VQNQIDKIERRVERLEENFKNIEIEHSRNGERDFNILRELKEFKDQFLRHNEEEMERYDSIGRDIVSIKGVINKALGAIAFMLSLGGILSIYQFFVK
jgi:hypothetical protein